MVFMLCAGLFGKAQTQGVAACMERIKTTAGDSLRLIMADSVAYWLDSLPWQAAAPVPVKYLGYKKCLNAEAELYSWAVPLTKGQACYNLFRFQDGRRYLMKYLPGEEGKNTGWLYYDWIAFQAGKEECFALMGWNRTATSNEKIIRLVYFRENGEVLPRKLMRRGNSRSAFLSFEYAPDGSMMLKHDKKGKRIIFDHLAPVDKKYEGYFMFYGPDASYDALVLKKGEWHFTENVKY